MKTRLVINACSLVSLLFLVSLDSCARAPYSIGFIGPMTGPSANIGVEGYRGFTMAVEEANAGGGVHGRQVVVHMLDDQSNPDACLAAAKELVGKGVAVLVLHTTSGAAAGALPWLLEQDVLVVSRTVSDPAWEGLDDNFLRFVGSTELFGQPLGVFAASRMCSKIGIVVDALNAGFADSMAAGFLRTVGGIPVIGRKELDSDWSPEAVAAWVMGLDVDGVFAVLSGLEAARLAQALERSGFAGDLYLSPWSQDHNLLNYAGRLASRIFLASSFNPDDPSEGYQEFRARHEAIYADAPVMSGVFGYEIASFILEGIKVARRPEAGSLKKALMGARYFNGLQYGFTLDANGDAELQSLVIGIRDGVFVPVGE
ncbi:MAG: ABC transporter substrate-binding protein [Spirochaetota bacterium]